MSEYDTLDPTAPTDVLISFALSHPSTDEDDDPHWEAVRVLHGRGTREVFDAATRLLASDCARTLSRREDPRADRSFR